jgi:phage/plasmid-associated DNA primase
MVLTCNNRPELPPEDEGTWRRVVLVEYNSKFRHEPKGEYNEDGKWVPLSKEFPEFPIDETLNEKFEDWAEPFMSILLHIYNENKHKDLREPKEVKEYTEKYREQNNHFKEFINDKVIVDLESDHILRMADLFTEYKDWFRENYGNGRAKKQKDLSAFMDKEYGDYHREETAYTKRGYKGLMLMKDAQFMNELPDNDGNNDELDS